MPEDNSSKIGFFRILRKNWMAWYALWFLVLYIAVIVVSIYVLNFNPYDQQTLDFFRKPRISISFTNGISPFILGTDDLGRDFFARLIYACRNTFSCAFIAAVISFTIGGLIGFAAAFFPCRILHILRILVASTSSYTPLILAFAFITVLGPSLKNATAAIAVSLIPRFAAIAYEIFSDELKKDYITAVKLDGASLWQLFRLSLLPNIRELMVVQFTKHFSMAILDISALGFLGLCVVDPEPELGNMISENMDLLYTGNYWIIIFPGFAIIAFVIAINVLSDGIRTVLHRENS